MQAIWVDQRVERIFFTPASLKSKHNPQYIKSPLLNPTKSHHLKNFPFNGLVIHSLQPRNNKINHCRTPITMDIQHLCSNIKESIDILEEAVGDASPIYKPFQFAFRPKPNIHHKHQRNSSDLSIEEDISSFCTNTQQYKCFKCYGVTHKDNDHSLPLCQQCDGTERISDMHPLAALFDKVFRAKLPTLAPQIVDASSQTVIDAVVECHHCRQKIQSEHTLFCEICPDIALCQPCFDSRRYLHSPSHNFVPLSVKSNLLKLQQKLPTMKKISEQVQSQSVGCCEQILCSNCSHDIQQCYQKCKDCDIQGKTYILCTNCLQQKKYQHDMRHEFEVEMVAKEPKFSVYSNRDSQQLQITSLEKELEVRNKGNLTERSIVCIDSFEPQEDYEEYPREQPLPQLKMESSETEEYKFEGLSLINPESAQNLTESSKSKLNPLENSSRLRNQSFIKINMEESQEISFDQIILRQMEITTSQTAIEEELPSFMPNDHNQDFYFTDYQCDICRTSPLKNRRYHCLQCQDYDICSNCFLDRIDQHVHNTFEEIDGLKQKLSRINKVVEQHQRSSLSMNNKQRKYIKA